MTYQQVK